MSTVGDRIGHFRILGELGRGGMGEVYIGFDEALQRRVALKSIRPDRRLDASAKNRFLREARLLSQLDHPAICRIYDYVEGEERDLLALELIEGRTLRAAIADGLDYRTKLRIATDVARALAAAHRFGIVHRDLKPDNIMLTHEGQVKVLDFGIARTAPENIDTVRIPIAKSPTDLSAFDNAKVVDSAFRSTPAAPGVDFESETRLGVAIGTPAYMSPEQASGDIVTTASDMFSYGLVLQMLFTGKPAHEPDIALPALLERARRGEWLPPEGVNHKIAALINSLRAAAPSDRPTAVSVIGRLERIATRRQRILRRTMAIAAVLALLVLSVKYVVDVGHERNVAMQARTDAERRRGQAEALIGFMVGDLREKLTPVGRLDILDDVGEEALKYFRSLRPDEISPAELRRNAKTLSQIGEVRMAQGNLAAARRVFDASLVMAAAAVERDPADGENQKELGASYFWLGNLLLQQGDLDGALRQFEAYLSLSEKLAATDPRDLDYQLEVGYGHSNVGSVLEQLGKLEEALAHYEEAVKIKEARLRTDPGRPDWQADYATTVDKVGVVLRALGRYADAREALERENALLTSALAIRPDNAHWRERLAVNISFIGDIAEEQGDDERARGLFEEERSVERKLVEHDPANAGWQRNLALTEMKLGRLLRNDGRRGEAEAMLTGVAATADRLLKKDPKRVLWMRDAALVHQTLAEICVEANDVARAEREIADASAALARAPLREAETRRLASSMEVTRGVVNAAAGDEREARKRWEGVVESLQPSAATGTISLPDLDTLARALLHLGRSREAAPCVERLTKLGYRKHALVKLWEERRDH